jgi:hypothetical protein
MTLTNKNKISIKKSLIKHIAFVSILFFSISSFSQELPKIITDKKIATLNYLPDYSYAGYHFGEVQLPIKTEQIINATDYGVIANDDLDDSKSLLKAIKMASSLKGDVVLQMPAGRLILSDILYIERSNFVLRGAGSGENGTEIFCPRPMMYLKAPESLKELREYLTTFDKRQREKENNLDLPFSQYAWSGGFIWTQVPNERVKSYLEKYDPKLNVLAKVLTGKRGTNTFTVSEVADLKVGDVIELQLFNKEGENGEIIKTLYNNAKVKPGSHHWKFSTLPIVRQQVEIVKISKNKVTIKTPLLLEIKPNFQAQLVEWKHLSEVGIEHLRFAFPDSPRVAHHVEQGYNAIFLTRIFNSWVRDVVIHNAESGVLTEEIANVTIEDIVTDGNNMAHYTVAMGGVHNVLVKNLKIYNKAVHPLSFNTFSTKDVYQNCEIFANANLDQHAGANHQNLFDNVKVHVTPKADNSYPLFLAGGADYWRPSHGAFTTFWNIDVDVMGKFDTSKPIMLNGMDDGPFARLIGVHGNHNFKIEYGPDAYIESVNQPVSVATSLYDYQLKKRLHQFLK